MSTFFIILANVFAWTSAIMSYFYFHRVRSRRWNVLMAPKMLAHTFAPYIGLMGAVGAGLGLFFRSLPAVLAGIIGAGLSIQYVIRVTAFHKGFDAAFGRGWQKKVPPKATAHMLARRWTWHYQTASEPRLQCNLPFWVIEENKRELLCDIWQPPLETKPSGLALIYFHGGAWHALDKDYGTRPSFRHIAAQGHMVMDVAYRFCPEVDLGGILEDARRAIVWIKANANRYGVDPGRIVLAGGSSGAI
jgi:acetyl esterase/lipase